MQLTHINSWLKPLSGRPTNTVDKPNTLLHITILPLSPLATDIVRFWHSCNEKAQWNEGSIHDLPSIVLPSTISVVPIQPSGTYTPPSIFKALVITTSTPWKFSPLGPCPYFFPVWPVFPPQFASKIYTTKPSGSQFARPRFIALKRSFFSTWYSVNYSTGRIMKPWW